MNRNTPVSVNVYGADISARRGAALSPRQPAQVERQRIWKSDRAQSLEEDLSILRARENPFETHPRT